MVKEAIYMINCNKINRLISTQIMMLLLLIHTGCSHHIPPARAPNGYGLNQTLPPLNHWQIQGKIAIQQKKDHKTWSTNFTWLRTKQQHLIRLYGPFGYQIAIINITPKQATLKTATGQMLQSKSFDDLVAKATGIDLPTAKLMHWIQGMATSTADNSLWKIDYKKFNTVNRRSLPTLLEIQHLQYHMKIFIYRWSY